MRKGYKTMVALFCELEEENEKTLAELPDDNTYKKIFSPHNRKDVFWIMPPFPKDMTYTNGLFFCCLTAYQQNEYPNAEEDNSGWFPISVKQMKNCLGLSTGKQNRIFGQLEKAGYLVRKFVGRPPFRYVKLNYAKFIQNRLKVVELRERKHKEKGIG